METSTENIFTGLFNPSFKKVTNHFRVVEVLYRKPDLDVDTKNIIRVVMPHYLSKLSAHKSYYKERISGSYIYDRYPNHDNYDIKEKSLILYAKQHFAAKRFSEDEIVPVKGVLEWTMENSYDLLPDRDKILQILKFQGKIK